MLQNGPKWPFWGVFGSKKAKNGQFRAIFKARCAFAKVRKKLIFFCSKWAERPFWAIPGPTNNISQASWRNPVWPPGTLVLGSKWPLGPDSVLFTNQAGTGPKAILRWQPRCSELFKKQVRSGRKLPQRWHTKLLMYFPNAQESKSVGSDIGVQ